MTQHPCSTRRDAQPAHPGHPHHRRGVELWLARVRSTATPELEASGLADRLGPAHLRTTLEDGVQAYTGAHRQLPSDSS